MQGLGPWRRRACAQVADDRKSRYYIQLIHFDFIAATVEACGVALDG